MGGCEFITLVIKEPLVKYHPYTFEVLTWISESRLRTVHGGQFDWGGLLLKSNGGVRRLPRSGRKSD